jgi:branched-chain amino acid transport system substrate-binding protein
VQLARIKAANPEALYIYGYKELAISVKQAREMGIKAQLIGNLDFELPEVVSIAKEAAEGAIYTKAAYDPGSPDEAMREYQAKYKKKYGETSEAYAAFHHDMVKLICKAIESHGYTAKGIRKGLLEIKNYPGVSGETTFLANGDVDKPIILKTIKNGTYVKYTE